MEEICYATDLLILYVEACADGTHAPKVPAWIFRCNPIPTRYKATDLSDRCDLCGQRAHAPPPADPGNSCLRVQTNVQVNMQTYTSTRAQQSRNVACQAMVYWHENCSPCNHQGIQTVRPPKKRACIKTPGASWRVKPPILVAEPELSQHLVAGDVELFELRICAWCAPRPK